MLVLCGAIWRLRFLSPLSLEGRMHITIDVAIQGEAKNETDALPGPRKGSAKSVICTADPRSCVVN
jgi:hypothetical protein